MNIKGYKHSTLTESTKGGTLMSMITIIVNQENTLIQ